MRSSIVRRSSVLLATAVALALPFVVPNVALAQADEGTGVGVARISHLAGSVGVRRGDSGSLSGAVINAPVQAGDYLTTGEGSRAEVQVDGGTIVRLGRNVTMRFTRLDSDVRAMEVAEGTVALRLLPGIIGRSDIDTPSITVRPRSTGTYRVSVTGDGRTLVTVRSGNAVIVTPQGDQELSVGTTLVAQGPASNPSITTRAQVALDDFDRYGQDRDARYERALADQSYVSRDIVGADDLNAYGNWAPDKIYGHVWVPMNVAPDWAPYRNGRWVWEDNFGWTWIGYEPWGWAPYHYGSWYRSPAYGWCWYPPQYGFYAPWRPANVAFFSFGFGGGNIGWVPLAPYEPWHPWWGQNWHGGPGFGNNTSLVNNYYGNDDVLRRTYKNAQYGVTTVPGKRFLSGRFERPTVMKPSEMRNLEVVRGALPIVPTAQNLRYSDGPVAPQLSRHPAIVQRTFAGEAAPVRRMPFEQQRTAIEAATRVTSTLLTAPPETSHVRHTLQTYAQPAGDPWSRFGANRGVPAMRSTGGAPVMTQQQTPPQMQPQTSISPWNRFNGGAPGAPRYTESTRRSDGGPAAPPVTTTTTRGYGAMPRAYDTPPRAYAAPQPRAYDAPQPRAYDVPQPRAYPGVQAPQYVSPQQPHPTVQAPRQTMSRPPH